MSYESVHDCVNPSSVILQKHGAGSNQYYHLISNPPEHPGALDEPMPSFFMLPNHRVVERVPRPLHFSPPWQSTHPIIFSTNGFPGVRVDNIYEGIVTVDAGNDRVFEEQKFRSIVISLEWPDIHPSTHANHMRARIDVRPDGVLLTRQELAREICGLLIYFHRAISKHPVTPGWEKWALNPGPKGIHVCDVILFSLHYYRNVWVPEFYVIR